MSDLIIMTFLVLSSSRKVDVFPKIYSLTAFKPKVDGVKQYQIIEKNTISVLLQ